MKLLIKKRLAFANLWFKKDQQIKGNLADASSQAL